MRLHTSLQVSGHPHKKGNTRTDYKAVHARAALRKILCDLISSLHVFDGLNIVH